MNAVRSAYYQQHTTLQWSSEATGLTRLPHLHREMEIIYVREGSAIAHADLSCEPMRAGDLFISFPNQIHYYEQAVPGRYALLVFSPEIFSGLKTCLSRDLPVCNVVHVPPNSPCIAHMNAAMAAGGEYAQTIAVGHLNLMMSELLGMLQLRQVSGGSNTALGSIIDYCNENYAGELTLDSVAESLHLSKYYVSRLINGRFGLGFSDYVNILRVNRACELLETTDKKSADISEDVGFGTIRSFNRAFAHIMKVTPMDYRRGVRGQKTIEFR